MIRKGSGTIIFWMVTMNAMALYVAYRLGTVFYSLNIANNLAEICVIIFFIFAELFLVVNSVFYFINIITALRVYTQIYDIQKLKQYPEVTVMIPLKNEPLSVLRKTFRACHFLDYPNLKIVVVDSSDIPGHGKQVKLLANEYHLQYFMSPRPLHGAKAGALNDAMHVYKSPYYVLFDADYRPSSDFVKLVVPIIESDKKIAYVQTPQFYGNHERSIISRASQIQQSIFYEYICEGKSVHNAIFMCGTNIIIRRQALEEVGFWEEHSVTEDFATSLDLILAGWKSRYFNLTTAFGDGPLNLEQYLKQQFRWARGTFEGFYKNAWALFNPWTPITLWQRIEFILSGTYFFVGVIWLILIFMPILYIFLGIPGYHSDPLLFTYMYLPFFILSFAFYFSSMRARKYSLADLLFTQSLTFLTIPIYVSAFIATILRRPAIFQTVNKEVSPDNIPHYALIPQYFMIFLNLIATLYGLWIIPDAHLQYALLANIFWTFFHFIIMIYLILYLYGKSIFRN